MEYFVAKDSVVREIWGKGDTILLIFAGAAAEFALSRAVDWLYFTGRLPADPLGRLFSTVAYARIIVFSNKESALRAIDSMTKIHAGVEATRGAKIPDWAYRDVLFMLIDYSIRSHEVLERNLNDNEKQEVFLVFQRIGKRMKIKGLPENVEQWESMRQSHMHNNLENSSYTTDLFTQYRKNLGRVRYLLLIEGQTLVVPQRVRELLGFRANSLLGPLIQLYKFSKNFRGDRFLKNLILPTAYRKEIDELDVENKQIKNIK